MSIYTVDDTGNYTNHHSQSIAITTALRMLSLYSRSIPSHTRIMTDFGCSRATAYRWRKALVMALPLRDRIAFELAEAERKSAKSVSGIKRAHRRDARRKAEASA